MHRIATRPTLFMQMQHSPQGALSKAKQDLVHTALRTPVPADRWMAFIFREIERGTHKRLSPLQMRVLCTKELGVAIGLRADLTIERKERALVIRAGQRQVARLPDYFTSH